MANEVDMSSWTDLLHSSTKLLEQAARSFSSISSTSAVEQWRATVILPARDSDDEVYLHHASDDRVCLSGFSLKLQFRNVKSIARWNNETATAEVIGKKGQNVGNH